MRRSLSGGVSHRSPSMVTTASRGWTRMAIAPNSERPLKPGGGGGVVAVEKNFRILGGDLKAQRAAVIEEGNLGQSRRRMKRQSQRGRGDERRGCRTNPHEGTSD